MKLILLSGLMDSSMPDQNLIRLIAQAYSWFERLSSGAAKSVQEIADKDSVDAGDVSRTLPLAFLAPNIVEFILEGRQPKDWTAEKLKRAHEIPHCWAKQRHCLEFSKT